jgi:predicted DNA-binding transcriptional regulator YafY
VLSGLARAPYRHQVVLHVQGTAAQVRTRLPASVAVITEPPAGPVPGAGGWLRVELQAQELHWLPGLLASLGLPFAIEQPAELRDLVAALARRLTASARRTRPPSGG